MPTASENESGLADQFKRYAVILKSGQDKNERLFKTGRDIVIESKRIIFLLHSISREPSKGEKIFEEAENRLKKLESAEYQKIAKELESDNPFRHLRVVSAANQEYIEALTLFEYLKHGDIKGINSCSELPLVPLTDYVLGLADLSGELMRRCVASMASENTSEINAICDFLRDMYSEFVWIGEFPKLSEKLSPMATNVLKVERIKYAVHIMAAEAEKLGLSGKVKRPNQRMVNQMEKFTEC